MNWESAVSLIGIRKPGRVSFNTAASTPVVMQVPKLPKGPTTTRKSALRTPPQSPGNSRAISRALCRVRSGKPSASARSGKSGHAPAYSGMSSCIPANSGVSCCAFVHPRQKVAKKVDRRGERRLSVDFRVPSFRYKSRFASARRVSRIALVLLFIVFAWLPYYVCYFSGYVSAGLFFNTYSGLEVPEAAFCCAVAVFCCFGSTWGCIWHHRGLIRHHRGGIRHRSPCGR